MDIVKQFEINASIDSVYKAVTSPAGIQGWWSQNSEIATETGGIHTMNFVKEGNTIVMKFTLDELVANHKVGWTCVENGNPAWVGTKIGFELGKGNNKTQITFSHLQWDENFKDTPLYTSVSPTWDAFMGSLKSYCESGVGQPW